MTMYPEVHTLAGVNLHWSGVEPQSTPNATMAHRIILEGGTLEGGHRTRTILRRASQLNWRL
jgi:hypothetical protein